MTTARPLRWGILGAGGIAATVGADIAASPGSTIVAVAARDADRAAAFARNLDIPRSYGSYAELLADPDVDVVYLTTTHGQHYELALQVIEAGKPMLLEKPITINGRQAREVVAAARERRLFLMEAMWMRLNPVVRTALDLVAAGRIGEVRSVRADFSFTIPFDPSHRLFDPAVGGGALLDAGVYPATFAWLFLGQPDTVQAVGKLNPLNVDSTAAVQWGFADGRFGQIVCSFEADSPYLGIVTGTEGSLSFAGSMLPNPEQVTITTAAGTEVIDIPSVGNGYGHEVAEVERCLAEGLSESPFIPLEETVAILDTLDEARRQLGVRYDYAGE
jgi:predicted dehydrogenase